VETPLLPIAGTSDPRRPDSAHLVVAEAVTTAEAAV